MSVVGVDFGNQNAVIAAAGRGGVDVILNGNSNRLNPTMVGFSDSRTMGEAATTGASSNYRNTITCMKRLVGLSFSDPRAVREMELVPFECVPVKHGGGGPDTVGVKVRYGGEETVVSIEAVAGMMVKHLGTIAAEKTRSTAKIDSAGGRGAKVTDASDPLFPQDWVIAVPGYYTDAQRRAFLTGCEIAGVTGVQRLIHETTATALAYGIFKDIKKVFDVEKPTRVMFIDMGATALSASVVEFVPGKLSVKSSRHDSDLGGRDFDALVAQWLSDQFEAKFRGRLSGKPMSRPKTRLKLLAAAERAKKTLSPAGVREARISMECLMDDLDFGVTLGAEEYEAMCAPLLARLGPPVLGALEEAGLNASDLDSVEIVGGSTRIGCVKRTLASVLGLDASATNCGLSATMNADEAVARGAALQSAILSPRFKVLPYEIAEYQPYPIRIAWDGDGAASSSASQPSSSGGGEGMEVEGSAEGSDLPSNSVIMFDRGSNFPVVRRVTLRRAGEFAVTASYDGAAVEEHGFPGGTDREIATFRVRAPEGEESKIRVNVKEDIHGTILMSSVQMLVEEEVPEEEEVEAKAAEGGGEGEGKGEGDKKEGEEGTKKEGEEGAKKMEEGKAEGEGEAKPEKKKTRTKKVMLDYTVSRPIEWSKADKEKAYEMEVSMSNADRVQREKADMRNELESYIYDMRDKIASESHLGQYCTDAERAALTSALETSEGWLYEDGFDATKTVYADRLVELRGLGDPIVRRQAEAGARPHAVSNLQRTVEKYMNWLNTSEGEEAYAHITYDERTRCYDKCDQVSGWMYDVLDKQGALPQNVDPVVSVAEITAKITELNETVSPVMHKPKPKPKPEKKEAEGGEKTKEEDGGEKPKEAAEAKEGTNEAKGESNAEGGGGAEPMDTDEAPKENAPEPMAE